MEKLLLSTDDSQLAINFSSLMEGKAEVHIFPENYVINMDHHSKAHIQSYSHFVLGVDHFTAEALSVFKNIKDLPVKKMLLVKKLSSDHDIKVINDLGAELLIDPLEKVKYAMENYENVLDYLKHTDNGEECHHYNGEEVYVIDKNIYYHTSELWVGNFSSRNYLSDLERELLELFIEFEGVVLHSSSISNRLWHGQIEESSIRKLVRRLRQKLGDPELIMGRKQGGYIFKKRDANI